MTDISETLADAQAPDQVAPRLPKHAYSDGPRSAMNLFRWFRYGFIVFLILSVVLAFLSAILLLFPDMFIAMIDEYSYEFTPLDTAMSLVYLIYIPAYIFCIVMTCRITYRTMRNLHTISSKQVSNSPTMSVAYYFIPFANLVMPAQITSDIYRGTMKATEGVIQSGRISLWWTCWLTSNIADRVSYALGYSLESTAATLISLLLSIVAAYNLLRLFKDIAYAQEAFKHGGVMTVFD